MDVSTIITKSRRQTGTSVGQKSDALMLDDLNIVYKDIFSKLATKSKKYTRQAYTTDSIVWQNEYKIPEATVLDTGIARVLNVSIKYASDRDFVPCKQYDTSFPIDTDYTDKDHPYFINRDDSIFIYPAPSEVIDEWIKVEWQYIPMDLTLTTTSENIKLAKEDHNLLIIWLNAWNFADKQLFDKQALMEQKLDGMLKDMISDWWMEIESAYIEQEPENLDIYA